MRIVISLCGEGHNKIQASYFSSLKTCESKVEWNFWKSKFDHSLKCLSSLTEWIFCGDWRICFQGLGGAVGEGGCRHPEAERLSLWQFFGCVAGARLIRFSYLLPGAFCPRRHLHNVPVHLRDGRVPVQLTTAWKEAQSRYYHYFPVPNIRPCQNCRPYGFFCQK